MSLCRLRMRRRKWHSLTTGKNKQDNDNDNVLGMIELERMEADDDLVLDIKTMNEIGKILGINKNKNNNKKNKKMAEDTQDIYGEILVNMGIQIMQDNDDDDNDDDNDDENEMSNLYLGEAVQFIE